MIGFYFTTAESNSVLAAAAIASASLAFVATRQAKDARLAAERQATEDRQASVLPVIVADVKWQGDGFAVLRVANVGVGAALELQLTFSMGTSWTWALPVLRDQEERILELPPFSKKLAVVAKETPVLTVTGQCQNVFGGKVAIAHQLDLAGVVKGAVQAGEVLARDPLGRIASATEKIAGKLATKRPAGRSQLKP